MSRLLGLPLNMKMVILSRVPPKALARCRCVCKLLSELIVNPCFTKLYIDHAYKVNPKIMVTDLDCKYNYSLDAQVSSTNTRTRKLYLPYRIKRGSPGPIVVNGSCDGVICISNGEHCYLWSPTTRENSKLPNAPFKKPWRIQVPMFGFGCNRCTKEYKVVRFEYFMLTPQEIKVYTCGTNLWRSTVQSSLPRHFLGSYNGVPQVNGALHWMGKGRVDPNKLFNLKNLNIPPSQYHTARRNPKEPNFIVAFKIEYEEILEIPWPNLLFDGVGFFDLCDLEGCLSLFRDNQDDGVEMWVMKQYGVKESWVKLFIINLPPRLDFTKVLYVQNNSEYLLQSNGNKVKVISNNRVKLFSIVAIPTRFRE
ncbi:hypothetical protein GIB67_013449 [Kingdonia uniflora]|uniref:F-box domain-containing protein n=1 Tax=Kingdonia uniflora TaxID=39325 RepID=A0A7J7LRC7_9MAGN|nr:hypothetical protein GIB67_013449 [Kingdonia uniflora]